MKKILLLLSVACCSLAAGAQSLSVTDKDWHWEKGSIVINTPARPTGQTDVLQLTTPKLETVRVAFVGLGMRGPGAVARWTYIPGVQIVALCDYEEARAEACQKYLREAGLPPAAIYSGEKGYEEVCKRPDVDIVYVATDWDHHFPVAKCALENGKHTAIEVPSAMNLAQCWELIELSERTRKHCMILENCCYDWYELNTLNMAQQGLFGEILKVEGAYIHALDEFWFQYWQNPETDKEGLHWRLKYNRDHRGDIYPTHGLGPVAQLLNIHRGDKFNTLVAMDTKSVHGKSLVEGVTGEECPNFRNGDQTTTLIRTELGKMIEIQHNVMNPQPYNRLYKLSGIRGYATKYPVEHYALQQETTDANGNKAMDDLSGHEFLSDQEQEALIAKYQHPILKEFGEMAQEVGGHGGMDYIMESRMIYCLHKGLPMDIDVYDLAEWCCLAELGELSMDHNCAPVQVPDFTRGHWNDVQGFNHAY